MGRVILLAVLALATVASAQDKNVVITAARLLDVRTGQYILKPIILVTNGRIVEVRARPDGMIRPPPPTTHIELGDMTLLPGLIDMHVHLGADPTYGGYSRLRFGDRFWSVLQVPHAQRTLAAGFTTVRSVGGKDWNDVGLRQAIDEGKIPGPRIVSATYGIGSTGGHCDSTFFPPSMQQKNPYSFDSPESARQRVRELRKYGAQVIKICATGGVFSLNTEPGQQQLSLAEMKSIVEEAHMQGLKVAAHAHGATGIRDAILAGVDTIEHASLIDDEGIALAKKHGAWLSMDIYNTEHTQAEGKKNGTLEENRWMVRYGMTPLEAIRSATLSAAEALGRNDIGIVEKGRFADLVAVRGDPLADVTVLESVEAVIKGGEHVK